MRSNPARRCSRFFLTVESLEKLQLLASIALYGPTVVTEANNGHLGYALPGMGFLRASCWNEIRATLGSIR